MHNRITQFIEHAPDAQDPRPIMAAFLDGNLTLAQVCELNNITLAELAAWARSDWARQRFDAIRALGGPRAELIPADARPQALQTLTGSVKRPGSRCCWR